MVVQAYKESPLFNVRMMIFFFNFPHLFPSVPGILLVARALEAKKLLASVFNESLYLVLSGFTMSSIFSKCQLDCRPPDA